MKYCNPESTFKYNKFSGNTSSNKTDTTRRERERGGGGREGERE